VPQQIDQHTQDSASFKEANRCIRCLNLCMNSLTWVTTASLQSKVGGNAIKWHFLGSYTALQDKL
jgi:hypothetical protein